MNTAGVEMLTFKFSNDSSHSSIHIFLSLLVCVSSSSEFPARSVRFTILGEIIAYITFIFIYPAIEVVTFCGWCMLGVFLFLAFIRLGHECQDLLNPCDGMHVCTDKTLVYTLNQKSY